MCAQLAKNPQIMNLVPTPTDGQTTERQKLFRTKSDKFTKAALSMQNVQTVRSYAMGKILSFRRQHDLSLDEWDQFDNGTCLFGGLDEGSFFGSCPWNANSIWMAKWVDYDEVRYSLK